MNDENQRKLGSDNQDRQKNEVEGDDDLSEYDYQEKSEEIDKPNAETPKKHAKEELISEKKDDEEKTEEPESDEAEESSDEYSEEQEELKERKPGFFSKIKKRRQEKKEKKEKERQEEEKQEKRKTHSAKKEQEAKESKQKPSKESKKHPKKEEEPEEEEYYSIKADPKKVLIGVAVIIVLILLIFGIIYLTNKSREAKEAADLAEKNRPAKIQLYVISNSQCTDCANVKDVVAGLESSYNVTKINELDFDSAEAKQIIGAQGIVKIPSVIVVGELSKTGAISGFTEGENAYILSDIEAPYTDVSSGEIKGRVSMILINAPCRECVNLTAATTQMKSMTSVVSDVSLESSSDEANALISKYSIKKLPTLIISDDVKAYSFADLLENVGTYETDGVYVLRNVSPPYYDLAQSKIVGLVKVTYISDRSCADCYNVSEHQLILEGLGMKFSEEKYIDVSEESFTELKNKYSITKVPTIVLSSEAMEYATFKEVWGTVGAEEADGTLVFTQMDNMGTYRDLTTGKIVNATVPQ